MKNTRKTLSKKYFLILFLILFQFITSAENNKTIFTISELEQLGASTIEESLSILKDMNQTNYDTLSKNSKKSFLYDGKEFMTNSNEEVSAFLKSIPLNQIDQIEISKNKNQIKYHLSKSLTKDGVKALFSFSIIEEITPSKKLNPVVSTATKSPIANNQLGDIVKTITAEEIETLGITNIDEALNLIGNLTVSDTAGVKTLFLRGFSNGNTKVLFNGIDLKDSIAVDGEANFGFIPIEDVAQIEILSGSNSLYYGSGSVAGVINIITKSKDNNNYVTSRLANKQYHTTLKSSFELGNTHLYLLGTQSQNNSLSTFSNTTESDLYSNQSVSIGFNHPQKASQLSGLVTIIEGKQELDSEAYDENWQVTYADDPDYYSAANQKLAKLAYNININTKLQSQIQWAGNNMIRSYQNVVDDTNSNTANAQYEGSTQTVEFNTLYSITPAQALSFGSDFRQESGSSTGTWFGSSVESVKKTHRSIGAYTQYRNTNNWLSTQAGIRVENYSKSSGRSTISSYQLSVFRALPILNTQVKATLKSGFKLPSIYQRYNPSYGNADLKIETSETKELTFTKEIKHIKASSTFFESTISDQIAWSFSGYVNQNKNTFTGTEYSLEASDLSILSFIKFDYTDFNSNVSKVPTFKANLSAGATLNKWRYGLSIISVGETTLPGFSYTDITLNYDLDKSSSIFTKIHNLFNTDYETVNGYTEAGFTLFTGIKRTF